MEKCKADFCNRKITATRFYELYFLKHLTKLIISLNNNISNFTKITPIKVFGYWVLWDFGGQAYYHSTHQFFLTKRSLYILVNNTRSNKTDFNHCLQIISSFSDNSPVIIVENEVGAVKSELDLRGLQQHFDNILYVRVTDDWSIEVLKIGKSLLELRANAPKL